ncbi:MAG TPA: sensor histidine kinase [Streptosporangiaceae bacterium]|nr:sensor histidine kinase [Streptosporangiaceae bacterium]
MGARTSADAERPLGPHRSTKATFVVRLALPAGVVAFLWALAVGVALGSGPTWWRSPAHDYRIVLGLVLLSGGGIFIAVFAIISAWSFTQRIERDMTDLADAAERLAARGWPQSTRRRRGDRSNGWPTLETAEAARVIAAMTGLRHRAAEAATDQASLRTMGLSEVFISLARRSQSLLQRQLQLIDTLEHKASDPDALADLFALDHLTTRMRRHAESLTIVAGAASPRSFDEPVPMIDVIRAAMAEVEDYTRVTVRTSPEDALGGLVVADMIHLLAELIENATLYSPSGTPVHVRTKRDDDRYIVEIEDSGLGIEADQLATINQDLTVPLDFDLADTDRLGLFVAGKLAARHRMKVTLHSEPYVGTTAVVVLPAALVVQAATEVTPISRDQAEFPELTVSQPNRRFGARWLSVGGEPGTAEDGPPPAIPHMRPPTAPAAHPKPPPRHASRPASAPAASAQPPAAVNARVEDEPVITVRRVQRTPGSPGLPHRTRQASLSPFLRDTPPLVGPSATKDPAPADLPSPEAARAIASSLQSGWLRGRQESTAQATPADSVTTDTSATLGSTYTTPASPGAGDALPATPATPATPGTPSAWTGTAPPMSHEPPTVEGR